jgi:hypothetical protein
VLACCYEDLCEEYGIDAEEPNSIRPFAKVFATRPQGFRGVPPNRIMLKKHRDGIAKLAKVRPNAICVSCSCVPATHRKQHCWMSCALDHVHVVFQHVWTALAATALLSESIVAASGVESSAAIKLDL